MNLAGRDILHAWPRFLLTGAGLGLLIGVTLSMAGIYRGMVDDARALIENSGADLWVVQHGTLGPYAEPSSLPDDFYRDLVGFRGVESAANVTYLTMQVRHGETDVRSLVVGVVPGGPALPGQPPRLVAGRHISHSHYEAVADAATGLRLGDAIRIRRHQFTVVGLTRRMVSSSGDPMIFIPLQDAQDAQFLKDNGALLRQRRSTRQNPAFTAPGSLGVAEAVIATQSTATQVNAVLIRLAPGADPAATAESIRRWKRVQVYTRPEMEEILIGKLIATSARQIGLFLVILSVVSAAIVAFIIHTMTLAKLREIAVLKLVGARNRTIAAMILQQALALGLIGFAVGKVIATAWAPHFPKYVLLLPGDTARGFVAVVIICTLASLLAIRVALKVDPAEAIG